MSDATRRTFLAAAGTGAAAAAAAVAAAPGASAAPGSASESTSEATGPRLVAYVDNPRSGRLTVMYGEDEVTIQDADLVRRLTRAAGK